jgi:2'-5' RNA ligase
LTLHISPPTRPFSPHATLLSSSVIGPTASLDDIKRTVEHVISSINLQQVICKFDKLEAGETFFQCVYIKLQKQESEGLLALHTALRRAFGDTQDLAGTSYYPHFSLVYGDLPQEKRKEIIQHLYSSQIAKTSSQGHDEVAGYTSFVSKEIQIVKTVGSSDQWEIVATVPLGSQSVSHEEL